MKYKSNREIMDKNYSSKNLLINFFLNNLINKTGQKLKNINAINLKGLDVGCGEAHLLNFFYKERMLKNLAGIDINSDKLLYARQKVPYYNYVQGDIKQFPFKENAFDFIIASEVIEHVIAPHKVMHEIVRVCKGNGCIIISVPHEPFFSLGNFLRGKYIKYKGRTPSHMNFWNRTEFKSFITEFIAISDEHYVSVFPWLLYAGQLKK